MQQRQQREVARFESGCLLTSISLSVDSWQEM